MSNALCSCAIRPNPTGSESCPPPSNTHHTLWSAMHLLLRISHFSPTLVHSHIVIYTWRINIKKEKKTDNISLSMLYQSNKDDKVTLSTSRGVGHNDTTTGRRDIRRVRGQKLIISLVRRHCRALLAAKQDRSRPSQCSHASGHTGSLCCLFTFLAKRVTHGVCVRACARPYAPLLLSTM